MSLAVSPRRPARALVVLLPVGVFALFLAVACQDLGTAPSRSQRLTSSARANDWACVNAGTGWYCEWSETEGSNYWYPPPDWGYSTDPAPLYGYCTNNPNACGGAVGGGGPSGPAAYSDDTGWDTYLGEINPADDPSMAIFDCRVVQCPAPSVIINSPNVQKAAAVLQQMTLNDGLEHGAWLYLNADGTIRVGPILTGTATNIPALRTPPDAYVIGSIHSHPPGVQWAEGPSSPDKWNALSNNIYVVVRTVNAMYVFPDAAAPGWRGKTSGGHE